MLKTEFFRSKAIGKFNFYQYTRITATIKDNGQQETIFPISLLFNENEVSFFFEYQNGQVVERHTLLSLNLKDKGITSYLNEIYNDKCLSVVSSISLFSNGITPEPSVEFDPIENYDICLDDPYCLSWKFIDNLNIKDFSAHHLFIDFLLTFQLGTVFEDDIFYAPLASCIEGSSALKFIKAKYNFLYWKANFRNVKDGSVEDKYISDFLFLAYDEWISCLFSEDSSLLEELHGWFLSKSEEIDNVIFKAYGHRNRPIPNLFFGERTTFRYTSFEKWIDDYIKGSDNKEKLLRLVDNDRQEILEYFNYQYDIGKIFRYIGQMGRWIGWLLLHTSKLVLFILLVMGIWGGLVQRNIPEKFALVLATYGLIIFVSVIASNFRNPLVKKKKPSYHLLSPNLIISIVTGWLALLPFSNELWELNIHLSMHNWRFVFLMTALAIILLSSIYHDMKLKVLRVKFWPKVKKLILFFLVGFSCSLLFGMVVLNITSPYMFNNKENFIHNPTTTAAYDKIESLYQLTDTFYQKIYKPYSELTCANYAENYSFIYKDMMNLEDLLHSEFKVLPMNPIVYNCNSVGAVDTFRMNQKLTLLSLDNTGHDIFDRIDDLVVNEVKGIAGNASKKYFLAYIDVVEVFGFDIFIFPRLLILNGTIAFIIGFFIQFISSSGGKSKRRSIILMRRR